MCLALAPVICVLHCRAGNAVFLSAARAEHILHHHANPSAASDPAVPAAPLNDWRHVILSVTEADPSTPAVAGVLALLAVLLAMRPSLPASFTAPVPHGPPRFATL